MITFPLQFIKRLFWELEEYEGGGDIFCLPIITVPLPSFPHPPPHGLQSFVDVWHMISEGSEDLLLDP